MWSFCVACGLARPCCDCAAVCECFRALLPQHLCCMTAASGCGGVQQAGAWKRRVVKLDMACGRATHCSLQPNQPLAVIESPKTVTPEYGSHADDSYAIGVQHARLTTVGHHASCPYSARHSAVAAAAALAPKLPHLLAPPAPPRRQQHRTCRPCHRPAAPLHGVLLGRPHSCCLGLPGCYLLPPALMRAPQWTAAAAPARHSGTEPTLSAAVRNGCTRLLPSSSHKVCVCVPLAANIKQTLSAARGCKHGALSRWTTRPGLRLSTAARCSGHHWAAAVLGPGSHASRPAPVLPCARQSAAAVVGAAVQTRQQASQQVCQSFTQAHHHSACSKGNTESHAGMVQSSGVTVHSCVG